MFATFAGPFDRSDETDDVIRLVATEHSRAVGQQFVSRYGDDIGRNSTGLVECIAERLQGELDLATVWRPAFGLAGRTLKEDGVHLDDPTATALDLALALGSLEGAAFDVSAQIPRPGNFAIGRYVVPIAAQARIQLGDNVLRLDRAEAPSLLFSRRADEFQLDNGADIHGLPRLRVGDRQILFANEALLDARHRAELPFPISARSDDLVPAWHAAYGLIAEASPDYLDWVTRAIGTIVPVQAPPGSMVSGSQGHRPGEVYMTDALEPIKLAEMLVHEASHQHYQIATFLGPVLNGRDPELYYSPVVQKERPIDKILLAYHAFANVILFLRICRDRGIGDQAFLASNLRRLGEEVHSLQQPLETSNGLTELGTSLWQPLAERLRNGD